MKNKFKVASSQEDQVTLLPYSCFLIFSFKRTDFMFLRAVLVHTNLEWEAPSSRVCLSRSPLPLTWRPGGVHMSPRAVQSSWLTLGVVPFTSVDTCHTEVLHCPTCPPCSTCPPLPMATLETAGPFTVCMVLYWTHTACVLLLASFTSQCAPKCPPRPVL